MGGFRWLGTTFGVILFAYFTLSPFSENIEFLMKKGSQNDAKIDAKIIKNRIWAAKGATNVDLEYFLVVF